MPRLEKISDKNIYYSQWLKVTVSFTFHFMLGKNVVSYSHSDCLAINTVILMGFKHDFAREGDGQLIMDEM